MILQLPDYFCSNTLMLFVKQYEYKSMNQIYNKFLSLCRHNSPFIYCCFLYIWSNLNIYTKLIPLKYISLTRWVMHPYHILKYGNTVKVPANVWLQTVSIYVHIYEKGEGKGIIWKCCIFWLKIFIHGDGALVYSYTYTYILYSYIFYIHID